MSDAAASPLSRISPFRAGVATMLIGAVLLGVGMLRTTAATSQPTCPPGTELVAKFEYKGKGKGYKFEKPKGNEHVVELSKAGPSGGKWTSHRAISHVLVKGGPGHKPISYEPPTTKGTFDNEGLKNPGGKRPDISNLQFCAPKHPPTTTTTTTTSTTEPTTTSTTSTTTTSPTTTSTTSSTSTTTTSSTSTTTTTEPEDTTTTEPEDTTTTEPGEVQGEVIVNTTIVEDDAEAAAVGGVQTLPHTGAPSVPLVVVGIALVLLGGTVSLVTRRRGATS